MAPDFEYLLRLEPYALISHSAVGIFVFCLPAGLALFLLWRALLHPLARALVALPPSTSTAPRDAGAWLHALLALVIGSATHVGWDAMTHRDTIGPVLFPVLRTTAVTLGSVRVPWYDVLQLASSVLGGLVVLEWLRRQVMASGGELRALLAPWRLRLWSILALASLAVGAWNAPRRGLMSGVAEAKLVLGRFAIGAMVGCLVAMLLLALLHHRGRFHLVEHRADHPGGTHGR
jgi:hypothetical protein